MRGNAIRGWCLLAAALFLLFFVFLFFRFNDSLLVSEPSGLDVVSLPYVQFDVIDVSYTGATYSVSNNGKGSISFGLDFGIEVLRNKKWIEVPHSDVLTSSIQIELLPEQSESFTCSWENSYGSLSSGQYRLVKYIDAYEDGSPHSYWVACEFIL